MIHQFHLCIYLRRTKTLIQKRIYIPMFSAAIFTITNIWKQPTCPSMTNAYRCVSLEEGMTIHSILLSGKFHGQRSLVGYSPWGCKESDMTEVIECIDVCVCVYIHIFNGTLIYHYKNFAICKNMSGSTRYYAKWNKSEKNKYNMISLLCGL